MYEEMNHWNGGAGRSWRGAGQRERHALPQQGERERESDDGVHLNTALGEKEKERPSVRHRGERLRPLLKWLFFAFGGGDRGG